jgi:hypothetical protein
MVRCNDWLESKRGVPLNLKTLFSPRSALRRSSPTILRRRISSQYFSSALCLTATIVAILEASLDARTGDKEGEKFFCVNCSVFLDHEMKGNECMRHVKGRHASLQKVVPGESGTDCNELVRRLHSNIHVTPRGIFQSSRKADASSFALLRISSQSIATYSARAHTSP